MHCPHQFSSSFSLLWISPHFLFPLFFRLLVLRTEPSAFHMPATPALCYSHQFIPTKPHLLLWVSLTFLGQVLVLNPTLCCTFNPWDTNPQHAFSLEITESTICCPGVYKFLLDVRATWYLGDFGGFDWVNRGWKYWFQHPHDLGSHDLQEVVKFSEFQ